MASLHYERVQAALPRTHLRAVAPYMLQLLRNVAGDGFTFATLQLRAARRPGSRSRGCILASPSYPANLKRIDQHYVYHWTRDGAIAAAEIAANPMLLTPEGVPAALRLHRLLPGLPGQRDRCRSWLPGRVPDRRDRSGLERSEGRASAAEHRVRRRAPPS
jgi:hypothetical protein